MDHRLRSLVLLAGFLSLGASYRTANFQVEAPTATAAQEVGQAAERLRKELALSWLGKELPGWREPCSIQVKITAMGAGGATSFAFDNGRVLDQRMLIEGSYDRVLNSVLPHEMTHVVFAQYFGRPVPRWADEGGAIFSEDRVEWERHEKLFWQVLNVPGRLLPLERLFSARDYPSDLMGFYAQAASIARFLMSQGSRPTFLAFVGQGMQDRGWEKAVKKHYGYRSLDELEAAWVRHSRQTRDQYKKAGQLVGQWNALLAGRVVRQSVQALRPPWVPVRPEHLVREMSLLLLVQTQTVSLPNTEWLWGPRAARPAAIQSATAERAVKPPAAPLR